MNKMKYKNEYKIEYQISSIQNDPLYEGTLTIRANSKKDAILFVERTVKLTDKDRMDIVSISKAL